MNQSPVTLKPVELKPKTYAQKCPVCGGFGTVSTDRDTLEKGRFICHACHGQGYILVPYGSVV